MLVLTMSPSFFLNQLLFSRRFRISSSILKVLFILAALILRFKKIMATHVCIKPLQKSTALMCREMTWHDSQDGVRKKGPLRTVWVGDIASFVKTVGVMKSEQRPFTCFRAMREALRPRKSEWWEPNLQSLASGKQRRTPVGVSELRILVDDVGVSWFLRNFIHQRLA